jgi:hypothetical protein
MRRSYADTVRDADEAMKIISPTYRELGREKYDEMMEKKDKEIKLQIVTELKELLNENSKNKSKSDTLIIYNYDLGYSFFFKDIIPSLLRELCNKYGNVHFISFGGKYIKDERKHYKIPHDIIQLNNNLEKYKWRSYFFENINDELLDQKYIDKFYSKFNGVYTNIYMYTFKINNNLEYINKHIEDIKLNTLKYFKFYDKGIDIYHRYEDIEKNDFD